MRTALWLVAVAILTTTTNEILPPDDIAKFLAILFWVFAAMDILDFIKGLA